MKSFVKIVLLVLIILAEAALGLMATSYVARVTGSHIGLLGVVYLVYATGERFLGTSEHPVVEDR